MNITTKIAHNRPTTAPPITAEMKKSFFFKFTKADKDFLFLIVKGVVLIRAKATTIFETLSCIRRRIFYWV